MCTLENHRVMKHSKRKTEKGQLTNYTQLRTAENRRNSLLHKESIIDMQYHVVSLEIIYI